jgi:hypothetical protein
MPMVLVRARRAESYIATLREALDELRDLQRQRWGGPNLGGPFRVQQHEAQPKD